jgi:hypothetical protein
MQALAQRDFGTKGPCPAPGIRAALAV